MYGTQVVKRGIVDFIVFDESEEIGILVELKSKANTNGEFLHQLVKYYEALTDKNGTFPKFISDRIKGAVIINWISSDKTGKILLEEFEEQSERIEYKEDFENLKEIKDKIKIIEIEVKKRRIEKL